MANIMIPTVLTQLMPATGVDPKAQLPSANEGSFALHLDRQLKLAQTRAGNLAGVQASKEAAILKDTQEKIDTPASVEAVLQQLMVDLKSAASKPDDNEPGQWTFQLKDMGLLEKLAQQAGMDPADLAPLQQMMAEKKSIPLADLFSALAESFKKLDSATEVTAAETYLPLLESFLAKLQVPPETIRSLDGQGVNGVGELDIKAFLQGLQAAPAPVAGQGQAQSGAPPPAPSFVMSEVEIEQLSSMLSEAGVPPQAIARMFPERILQQKALAGLRPEEGNAPVTMTQERLTAILQQAVAAVDQARPKADLPGFFNDLNTVLTQAGFQSSDVGWSPVVQGTVKEAYDELQKMVDLAMVKIEKINGSGAPAARTVSPEELSRALLQAASLIEEANPQVVSQPELLEKVNSILSRVGVEISSTNPVPTTPEALSQALRQAATTIEAATPEAMNQQQTLIAVATPQAVSQPALLDKVNTVLAHAGFAISPAKPEPTTSTMVAADPLQLSQPQIQEQVTSLLSQGGAGNDGSAGEKLTIMAYTPAINPETPQEANLAKAKGDKAAETMIREDQAAKEWLASGDQEASVAQQGDSDSGDASGGRTAKEFETLKSSTTGDKGGEQFNLKNDQVTPNGATGVGTKAPDQIQAEALQKAQPQRPFLSPELQQFAIDQISQGVLRGLRNNDHHLSLTLYPKELGEVKVDLQMRGNQLSMNFAMENHKVKEALQSSMGEFKDNLERRGFNLGAMSVSVDQQQNSGDSGKRYRAAWEQMLVSQPRQGTAATQAVATPANSGNMTIRGQQGGISLFV